MVVTFPDGTVYRFAAVVNPTRVASLSGGSFQITYQPLAGTVATLVDLDQANQVLATGTAPGNVTSVDKNNEVLFNPKRYKMTLPDGRAFTLNTSTGLESMTDLNGYQLTLSSRGIQYANPNIAGSGTGVTFTRDGQGRITAIQDPDSTHPPLRYGYDGFGNLQSFTDRMGNTTGFSYLPGTSLMKTLTPAKPGMPQPIANYYDNSGRLIKQVDSYGNEIDYSHDLADGKETVVDRAHESIRGQANTHHFSESLGSGPQSRTLRVHFGARPQSRTLRVHFGARQFTL